PGDRGIDGGLMAGMRIVWLQVTRGSDDPVNLGGLLSASLRLSSSPVTAGAVASGGVAWGQAAPGLVEWGVSAELLGGSDFAALRTAHRAAEEVQATFATEDGVVRSGRAYV